MTGLRRWVARLLCPALVAAGLVATQAATPAEAASVPAGYDHVVLATGLTQPVGMTIADDGRVFVTEKGGYSTSGAPVPARIRVIKNGVLLATPFATIPNVYGGGERGLLGIELDPSFATTRYVYVFYTARQPDGTTYRNRVSRLVANGDVAQTVGGVLTEKVLIELDQASSVSHQAGGLHFGADGKLYISTGDNKDGTKTPLLTSTYGKILRINPDGSMPSDNPFLSQTTGIYRAIWARGLRNPFTFAFQGGTGTMFVNDVGENAFEEINEGRAGADYGWPSTEGPTTVSGIQSPLHSYSHDTDPFTGLPRCAITGGAFYDPATVRFPADLVGDYLYADFCGGFIKALDPVSRVETNLVKTETSPVDVRVGADGALYYLTQTGKVARVRYTGSTAPSISTAPQSVTASVGEPAAFSVEATGAAPLTYQWQRGGVAVAGATQSTYVVPATTLADNGAQLQVVVRNGSGTVTSSAATLTVTSNKRPTATITSPGAGSTYAGGQSISFAATATDPENGTLPVSAFSWRVDFHHDGHVHPFIDGTTGTRSGTFVIPRVGETEASVFYRITLTVKDSGGLTRVVTRDLQPRRATLSLATNPAGLPLNLDGQPHPTPYSVASVVGVTRQLSAPARQVLNGVAYEFASWSDGGAAAHDVNTPTASTTYTATYRKVSGADLVVTAVTSAPAAPAPGQTARFSATIRNQGTVATPAGVRHGVLFSVDGTRVAFSDTSTAALAPGASRTVAANGTISGYTGAAGGLWLATAGQHSVTALVDDVNRIAEANESNNSRTLTLAVGAKPDLVVSATALEPAAPGAGAQVRFSAVVTNQGGAATPEGVIIGVLFRVDGTVASFSDTSTTALLPGQSRTLTANGGGTAGLWTATTGGHTLLANVDDINRIAESVETNNTLSRVFTVP